MILITDASVRGGKHIFQTHTQYSHEGQCQETVSK